MNDLHTKQLPYYQKFPFRWLELYVSWNWWVVALNMHNSHFFIHHFVSIYMHNSKIKGYTRMLYPWMTALLPEIAIFWVRAICETWLTSYGSKHSSQPLQYYGWCVLTLIPWKLQVVYGRSIYQTTTLLSVMFTFCVRAGCEIWLVSSGSKHKSQYLFD